MNFMQQFLNDKYKANSNQNQLTLVKMHLKEVRI